MTLKDRHCSSRGTRPAVSLDGRDDEEAASCRAAAVKTSAGASLRAEPNVLYALRPARV